MRGFGGVSLIPRDHWEHHFRDFLLGLAALLGSKQERSLLHILGIGDCLPVRSGRAALVAAIRGLDLPVGGRVGVPLFCCPVVFKAVISAGCKPVFLDVDPETYCLATGDLAEKRPGLDALVAVHMFGNVCDVPALQTAAAGKPVIEDCAQALGSKLQGRMVGSLGDVSFFSFRSGKYLSVGEGGALYSRHKEVFASASRFIDAAAVPSRLAEFAHAGMAYIKSILRSKPLYGLVGYHLWNRLNREMNLSAKSGVTIGPIYQTDVAVLRRRFSLLQEAIGKQRANADFYSRALQLKPGMLCLEKPGAVYNRYLYPVALPSRDHRDQVAGYLFSRGIDTMKYLDNVAEVAAAHYGYQGDCPTAEALSRRVLIIPSYYSLKLEELQHIARCVNEAWAELGNRHGV